ncbi:hypothetical protein PLESTB_000834400 [Pleodorina starrii]|uniref:Uncharacterized protein n=1 Tax=Pleodorina starrii TaxID=330485 RepID=A0A9W6BMC6_9CHLO|nr:hypothetical protein PLESTM_000150200 [Pleodorina starrii]GLC54202.1 hypothetical protein PLESTB_000834400 [Pleodorina starrii]GLC64495.1 hypothetical protein PLESTF_000172300 [Pleodorina starrii]
MLQSLLLDSAVGSRLAGGSSGGALAHLLRAVLQQPCRTASSLADTASGHPAGEEASGPTQPCCSTSGCSDDMGPVSGGSSRPEAGGHCSGFRHRLPLLLQLQQQEGQQSHQQQRRGISTTSSAHYKFDSHLTRYNKSRVVNRDNFQRFRDSGRDARVAADILQEAERQERRGSGRRGGRGDRSDEALLELKSMVHDCRDLRAMQVLVRECANDLDASLVCNIVGRLPQLKQDTPAAAAPDTLARRIADALMARLELLAAASSPANLAHALLGVAHLGLMPRRPLLEAVVSRLGSAASLASEADAKTVSKLLFATAKLLDLQRREQRGRKEAEEEEKEDEEVQGDVLRERLWPALRAAGEVKLLRALGEEPPGGAAAAEATRRRRGAAEEDDSMPQSALRFTCIALALARETHPGTWTAAARLAARHAAELQPAVAAGVLRSYALAGGAALDGGSAGLFESMWAALGPQVHELEAQAQLDLLISALKLAAAKAGGAAAEAAIPALCRLLAARVPALSSSDASHLAMSMAELHSKAVAEAAAAAAAGAAGGGDAAWRPHAYGALPRLLADLLLLRGVQGFGAAKFASTALALGLLGHADVAFWRQLAAAATPEVPRLDGASLSRLLGGFRTAAFAAEATAGSTAAVPSPPPEMLAAAHARVGVLLDGGGGGISGKALFQTVRSLAELPLTGVDGGAAAATLTRLADRLVADEVAAAEAEAAPAALRERLAAALRRGGLGEHPLVGRLSGGGQ